ncbi:MAG: DNA polymerase III subunit alpha [Bacteroidota bacterium]
MAQFTHLHSHTAYSLLDGAASIKSIIQQTKQLGMNALAITDHGNMFGVPHFINAAQQHGVKPIIGCECYVASDLYDRRDKRRYHQLLLAKNEKGYQNLVKLCSLGYTHGYYYKPRIDRKHIALHAEGLIATTCCLAAEVPKAIIEQGEEAAETIFKAWLDIFGNDYYIELQRHGIPEQDRCNQVLLRWSKKYSVKAIATNDVHYTNREDSLAQDIMLCLQTGKNYDDPNRMRFANDQFYLKSPAEMTALFQDVPETIANTQEITEKVKEISLVRDVLMPNFEIPKNFSDQDSYLRHLTFTGAQKRYQPITPVIEQRINYELDILRQMGYAGYMLIVSDMIEAAKRLGVVVGPGRGSAAGSVVAYSLGITDVDPIHYNLLFERFLNPDRVSMPDIDTDLDDEGRQKVIDYLVEKYGQNQVAQIITFGTMGARSAIRDVARVLGVPLATADQLAKLVPEKPGTSLAQAFKEVPALQGLYNNPTTPEGKVLRNAKTLENSPRHAGIHAAGILIASDDLTQYIPVKKDKESQLLVSQYDGSVIESVGMLKMDLLGLKTLSIIRDTVTMIPQEEQPLDIKSISLDDAKTFELYQRGRTIAIFQFESEGMRQWLTKLQPTNIEHLIAMNALYRPGPMQHIPSYIERLHGREKVTYQHAVLEKVLSPTYGIPVYQEQIMQMAETVAGYTVAQADLLRRAMGKKKKKEMDRQRAVFIEGAQKKNHISEEKAITIFDMMAAFAEYGFNRSHAVAYTVLSYQTAYLKAHYPAAFMAAVLTHNQKNITKLAFLIDECHRMGIDVLGPDINESQVDCSNTDATTIRFGLAAIKGVGRQAVESLVSYRNQKGVYKNFHEVIATFVDPLHNKTPSRSTLENMAQAGVFDNLGTIHRKQYVDKETNQISYIEQVLRYEQKRYKENNQAQQSLFGSSAESMKSYATQPSSPEVSPYTDLERLQIEKDLLGCYVSGHPLAPFQLDINHLCTSNTQNALASPNQLITLAGMVTTAKHLQNKQGRKFAKFTIEDQLGTLTLFLFAENYSKYQHLAQLHEFVYIKAKVKERPYQKDVWDITIQSMEPLHDIRIKYTKQTAIKLDISSITPLLVEQLYKVITDNPGKCPLSIYLVDPASSTTITTRPRKLRITPTNAFFEQLDRLSITYRIQA